METGRWERKNGRSEEGRKKKEKQREKRRWREGETWRSRKKENEGERADV